MTSITKKPTKDFKVVKKLAETMGLIEPEFEKISHNKISDEKIEVVKAFYMRDDVSRQAPGLKDHVTVWGLQGKERLQKRHLLVNIQETFEYFVEENTLTKNQEVEICYVVPT